MQLSACAKINLTLDIVGKRPDGYHKLSGVMHEISLCDTVEVHIKKIKGDNRVRITVKNGAAPEDENNICHKAAMAFMDEYGVANTEVSVAIDKIIPVAAGLGGGSSDAAAVIKALDKLFKVNALPHDLEMLAANIGADVPFFIRGKTQLAEGMGEILTPLEFPFKCYYIICKPNRSALTKEIFRDFDNMLLSGVITSAHFTTKKFLECVKYGLSPFEHIGNMLAPVVEGQIPEIADIRKRLTALGGKACMTGSGTAVFGVFQTYAAAVDALNSLKPDYENTYLTV